MQRSGNSFKKNKKIEKIKKIGWPYLKKGKQLMVNFKISTLNSPF